MLETSTRRVGGAALSGREVPFGDHELFFSRTDPHGIIEHGNTVFQRVSGYGWDELVGRPHKIIRHPHTPRAVFRLLWRESGAGRPIGAYVLNLAKNGDHYWVFAIVTPIEGGFLSVRLKPGSEIAGVVAETYRDIAGLEARRELEVDAALEELNGRLTGLGYVDYADFMASALHTELMARDGRMGRPADESALSLLRLRESAAALLRRAEAITAEYDRNAFLPANFRILAAHLGPASAAMGAVAANYGFIARELNRCVEQFRTSARALHAVIQEGVFLACVARVQREMCDAFRREATGAENAADITALDGLQSAYDARAFAAMHGIGAQVEAFRHDCVEMKRLAAGLEITRLIGKRETATLATAEALDSVLGELGEFQKAVAADLRQIEILNGGISAASTACLRGAGGG